MELDFVVVELKITPIYAAPSGCALGPGTPPPKGPPQRAFEWVEVVVGPIFEPAIGPGFGPIFVLFLVRSSTNLY